MYEKGLEVGATHNCRYAAAKSKDLALNSVLVLAQVGFHLMYIYIYYSYISYINNIYIYNTKTFDTIARKNATANLKHSERSSPFFDCLEI